MEEPRFFGAFFLANDLFLERIFAYENAVFLDFAFNVDHGLCQSR